MYSYKPKDECGVFGIYNKSDVKTSKLVYYALYSLQHRGQESCGIAINSDESSICYKNLGLVSDVFNDFTLSGMNGHLAIGHVRYSTQGGNTRENAQPLAIKYVKGTLSIAHNGQITNAAVLRRELENQGAIFQSTGDTEVIAFLIARERLRTPNVESAIANVVKKLKGSFSILLMSPKKIIAVRDSYGLRPLSIGKLPDGSICFSSETCAFDAVGADFVRDIKPGEIVVADKDGLRDFCCCTAQKTALCIFEHIYFARPDSVIDGQSVYNSRVEAGKLLARQKPVDADIVIGVPDSGNAAAMGYAMESGIPYAMGLIKNRYIGRTFIQPTQAEREKSVSIKLNALAANVKGKRVIMIDDSIVRGTTIKQIVNLLKKAGATEIHLRISSAPFKYPCFYGTDVPSKNQLISNQYNVEELNKVIGTNSLDFLSIENLDKIAPDSTVDFCKACFTGEYPAGVMED